MTQKSLTQLAKRWQIRLRLLDWKVKIKFVSAEEFNRAGKPFEHSTDNAMGFCVNLPEARQANIYIVNPAEVEQDEMEDRVDVENTLVHELLHLHFAPFANKHPDDDLLYEQAIEAITGALLG